jgi:hypothetical protein
VTLVSEDLSRRIVRDISAFIHGGPTEWVPVETIARGLVLGYKVMIDQAIELARRKGGLNFAGVHSICLAVEVDAWRGGLLGDAAVALSFTVVMANVTLVDGYSFE